MRIFNAYFRRTVMSPLFLFSILGVVALCLFGTISESRTYAVDSFDVMLHISTYRNLIVLMASLPFSAVYCRELKNKVSYYTVVRSSVPKNLITYIVASSFISFIIAFMGMLISIIFMKITYPEFIDTRNEYNGVFSQFRTSEKAWLYIFILIYHYSISISAWSVSGLAVSAVFTNPYIAVCSPIVLSYLFEMFTIESDILPNLWQLSLSNTNISDNPLIASAYITIVFLILGIIFSLIFYKIAERRAACEIV